jgi:uncharacterized membrane protein
VPTILSLVLGVLFLVTGAALVAIAALGARSRLDRNRWAGIRTAHTLESRAAWVSAHRVAAAPLGAAGAVCVVAGIVLVTGPAVVGWVVAGVGLVGTLVLAAVGGALGDRAAQLETASREPEPVGCTGSCAGCDLVAGCRPQNA